jgi:prepilin-type N-terminal cleavage/methylation domain-containing protein
MKCPHFRCRSKSASGFTLVELLVVIAIIAILAGTTLSIASNVIKAAKKAKAQNTVIQIQTACLAYYTEYSVYPVGTATTASAAFIGDTTSSKASWGSLMQCLCGNIKPSTGAASSQTAPTNTRSIAFLNMKASDVDANDAPLNPLPTGTGASAEIYFNITMDAEYCGVIGIYPSSYTSLPNFATATATTFSTTGGTTTAGVAVWGNCNNSATLNSPTYWVHTY